MERTDVNEELKFLEDTLKNLAVMVELSMNLNDIALKTLGLLENRVNALLKIWSSVESLENAEAAYT